jgi:hypothetical protein
MISSNTYEEVYEVLSCMDKMTVMKIPSSILNKIKDNRNINYETKINKNDIFNEQNLSKEAVDLLCWLNYTYLIDNEKKYSINKKIAKINIEQEKQKRKQYDPNNLFKIGTNFVDNGIQQESNRMVEYKEKRLFQVSDMLTFIDKIVYKHDNKMALTNAEKYFFSVKDILGIIRQLKPKRWKN